LCSASLKSLVGASYRNFYVSLRPIAVAEGFSEAPAARNVRVEHVHVNEGGQAVVGAVAVPDPRDGLNHRQAFPVLGAAPGFR
jgi:hypothetical protein